MSLTISGLLVLCSIAIVGSNWIFPDAVQFNLSAALNKNCGQSPYTDRFKPEDGRVFENPWLVLFRHPEEQEWLCQGTLVTDRHILTTAICSEAIVANETIIILGGYNQKDDTNCGSDDACSEGSIIERLPRNIIVHPEFQNETYQNDIALVTLNRPIKYSNNVMPVCLPLTPIIPSLIHAPIAYNTLRTDHRVPKQIQMKYISQDKCQDRLRDLLLLQEGQICAQYAKPIDVRISSGSGSPLVIEHHDRTFQFGILSIGLPDATYLEPYVYVNISTHIKWIHDTLVDELK
ncbi:CLIP domain-containing serine protease B10-like [Anopheles moucheti]|uniref:CLIP domain-containing serine protease B10-like n=1 Tax=Anopheles moucheti TaxID=186751 RepID=UPI0022F0B4FE|nr:CLIP domain-containing serine protease B10-like [Anopheles moucheti]